MKMVPVSYGNHSTEVAQFDTVEELMANVDGAELVKLVNRMTLVDARNQTRAKAERDELKEFKAYKAANKMG